MYTHEKVHNWAVIFLHRTGIQNLDKLTGTDVTQAWGKLKETPLYRPKKIKDLCHVHAQPRLRLEESKLREIRQQLIAAAPNSTLALHERGRGYLKEINHEQSFTYEDTSLQPMLLMEHLATSRNFKEYEHLLFHGVTFKDATKMTIYKANMQDLPCEEDTFYKKCVSVTLNQALDICVSTQNQDNSKWIRERMVRITGSKCHALYRFVPHEELDWDQKIGRMLGPSFKGNDATRYGKACEKPALEEYAANAAGVVVTLGLVINPALPWLGYSPDGVVFSNGRPEVLLEVKSPVLGKTHRIADLIKDKKVPYIVCENETYSLRPTHAYFSQVQLGLFLLDLEEAHFIVYSKVESLIVPVKKNATYIDGLIRRLQYIYFAHYLPHLAKCTK